MEQISSWNIKKIIVKITWQWSSAFWVMSASHDTDEYQKDRSLHQIHIENSHWNVNKSYLFVISKWYERIPLVRGIMFSSTD